MVLESYYSSDRELIEIGIDEVGRGPMLGRVYCAAVILPKEGNYKHELMKDSKKFHSKKKLDDTADYIKNNCLHYSIAFVDEKIIDEKNIKNATHIAMHLAINNLLHDSKIDNNKLLMLVDGRDFKPYTYLDKETEIIKEIPSLCIEGGDNKYTAIAAASILAKVERDNYIYDMCEKYPKLDEIYDLSKNKGYGTAKHMSGIRDYGITRWHRTSFGICKDSIINDIGN